MGLPWAMAQGAIAATTEHATLLTSTVPNSSAPAPNRATRRSCPTSLFTRATSALNFSSSLFPSIVSRAEVMIVSGVRSSWAALAGKLALHGKAFLEPIERMVYGSHQRHDFRRQVLFRQPHRRRIRTDRRCHTGNLAHGFEPVADC